MAIVQVKDLIEAGVHFGHLRRKWNPNMAPYIFTEKKGIHIIDLNKTVVKLDEAADALKSIARSGKKVLFVATKKQAKDIVTEKVKATGMPYVTERWSGGMLTNFGTIRRAIKKMAMIDFKMPPPPRANVRDFVTHIDYLVNLIGIDHVGISSDFDGGGGIDGWNDAGETFNVTLELVRRGYTEEQIAKIWSGNLLRVMSEVQKIAAAQTKSK